MKQLIKPPKSLLRCVGRALNDYNMIKSEDKILLGLSGGKDSLSLLHILLYVQKYSALNFSLAVITVDPEIPGFDPSPLTTYLTPLHLPYWYRRQAIMHQAQHHLRGNSFCAYCARMKRGIMYATARQQGYNVLALAQHLDDLAESFLMSAFHGGRLHTMKAHYLNDAGDIRIIRPLVYARERQTAAFAQSAQLPVIADNCPSCFSQPTERQQMKSLLAQQEQRYPHLFKNLLHAMRPLMDPQSD